MTLTLDKLNKDQVAYIVDMDGDETLRRKLMNLDISTNTKVQFLRKAPLGDPLEFLVNNNTVSLRKSIAQKIHAELDRNEQ